MAQAQHDLISMADIARLAGQSRATVGNWKSRNPEDFPSERGRASRGPLYDRVEVTAWLESTNRLDKRSAEVAALWHIADLLRDGLTTEDAMSLLLLLLAVMSEAHDFEWQQLLETPSEDLDSTLRAIAYDLFPIADGTLPSSKLPAQLVARAIATLSSLESPRVGLMADALLEQAAKALGHRGGEFLSPPSVRKLVVAIADPTGIVYNPASGVGQLMIDAASIPTSKPVQLVGQELDNHIWDMAQFNLALHQVAADLSYGDVFRDDAYPQLRADRVISVPPWNQRLLSADILADDPRWVWGEPGPNDGNAAWVQHCLSHLADDGRAVIVLPNSALFESGRAGRIRQRIIKAGLLDAVFALPPGLFAWTAMPCCVLVYRKGRPDVDGKPAPTLMVDLTESTDVHGSRSAALDSDLIDDVAAVYRSWVNGKPPALEDAAVAAVATFDDLAANDFVIDPGRYLSLSPTAPDFDKAMREKSGLTERLDSLIHASREADETLRAILEAHR
jgi:type I restriction-modification system DNA methylase subunit